MLFPYVFFRLDKSLLIQSASLDARTKATQLPHYAPLNGLLNGDPFPYIDPTSDHHAIRLVTLSRYKLASLSLQVAIELVLIFESIRFKELSRRRLFTNPKQ